MNPIDYTSFTVDPERRMLENMVDFQRGEVREILSGLTEEQARIRLVPSLTTPLALVKHATFVEKVWFGHRVIGLSRAELGIGEDVDSSFRLTTEDSVATVLAGFDDACAASRAIAARADLNDVYDWRDGHRITLRFILLHLVQEYARHCGHADILREQLF